MDNIDVVVFDCSSCPFMIDGFDKYYCHLDVNRTFPDLSDYIIYKMIPNKCPLIETDSIVRLSKKVKENLEINREE